MKKMSKLRRDVLLNFKGRILSFVIGLFKFRRVRVLERYIRGSIRGV